VRALAAAFLVFAASAAGQQVLYKWTDREGRVHFADRPPAGFKGEVTRIQTDAAPESVPKRAPPKAAGTDADEEKGKPPPDMATSRRLKREQLAARLSAAREKLEKARKALESGEESQEDEKQFVQERFDRNARRPERTPPPRPNCISQVSMDGKAIWICPRPIPNDAYYARQQKLEEAVKKAEEEVEEAERDYRRGVD
jgi:hypothetical protein